MRQILLLRGINLGPNRRVAMPALREALTDAGYKDVQTYVQTGNVVLTSTKSPAKLGRETQDVIAERFGFEVDVVVRSRDELAAVVASNPLSDVAKDPKRYQVSFLDDELDDQVTERLHGLVAEPEALVISGREIFAWHPEGVARSKLWNTLAGKALGVTATARNWTTVETLLEMADG